MDNMKKYITVLGARGSIPVSGPLFSRFGGATTSFLLFINGQYVILDAGTGLMNLPSQVMSQDSIPLLLTHAHIDHILGLTMCPYLMKQGARLDIYMAERGGMTTEAQVRRLFAPPLWPIVPEQLSGELTFHPLGETMYFGGIRIDALEGVHPGGVSVLRFCAEGKCIVLATDCTLTEEFRPRLTHFARNCDLLLCDGQYSDAEWPTRAGYGHNTWTAAARFGVDCGAKQMRIVHHDPSHTDAVLEAASMEIQNIHPHCGFAFEGEEIAL